ncbi:excalibur calcium-binding domain-containing protein [Paenibacillus glucanolyticus]|uniref:Excalibur calcium-binding domain-containing protein n=1 Tax=Paenibacillus glucanolyticus TaxID=59843 RepID=A0A163G5Y4_9BACL|nr:excalibur calcium-binding domain-containing protein [Paenibacillus glucanolyticus]KZS44749.1 hypothetical protein AWU65_01800 [Paenibacillus glucanolyticus]
MNEELSVLEYAISAIITLNMLMFIISGFKWLNAEDMKRVSKFKTRTYLWGISALIPWLFIMAAGINNQKDSDHVYYNNCSEARVANVAPLYKNEAGYRYALDRDGDGVACE